MVKYIALKAISDTYNHSCSLPINQSLEKALTVFISTSTGRYHFQFFTYVASDIINFSSRLKIWSDIGDEDPEIYI